MIFLLDQGSLKAVDEMYRDLFPKEQYMYLRSNYNAL